MTSDKDILKKALERFKLAEEAEADNRDAARDDIRFAKLSEQWPEQIAEARRRKQRPCLTINKLPAFIKQVVNDARQNKPSIKVHPVDSEADPETAEIINGLIKNIEYTSNASVAYDTAVDCAVSNGFGYWRLRLAYPHERTFDLDIVIDRVVNPLSVYGDPFSTAADSSDWNCAFITEFLQESEFKAKYPKAKLSNFQTDFDDVGDSWIADNSIMVAEYWERYETESTIIQLSDGSIIDEDEFEANQDIIMLSGRTPTKSRRAKSYKVRQYIMSGAEILETNDWPGKYIPIVPVYGDEVFIDNKRVLKSLIRDAKDPQRMFNYWRTSSTEMVALAPKTPFIGPKGSFDADMHKWNTSNSETHAFIEYNGQVAPQRQPYASVPAGDLQEALNASDDIKAVVGIYDPALGARSNETSGVAIRARQGESDTGSFHFIDNLNRAIAHTGRIIIDLVPHVYSGQRIIRVLGGDNGDEPRNVQLGDKQSMMAGLQQVYDLSVGKYDLVVSTGPSFTTRRQEAAAQMTELMRAFPESAQVIGDLLAKNMDWPGADEIAKRLQTLLPPEIKGENPEVEALKQQMSAIEAQAGVLVQQLTTQLQQAQLDKEIDLNKNKIDAYNAETNRLKAVQVGMTPEQVQTLVVQTLLQLLQTPDVTPMQSAQMMQPPAPPIPSLQDGAGPMNNNPGLMQ